MTHIPDTDSNPDTDCKTCTQTADSHKKSMSEAFINSFGSAPIGYAVGLAIFPLSAGWIQEDPFTATICITSVFSVVSFARCYLYRRVFERFGIDINFMKLDKKFISKFRSCIR